MARETEKKFFVRKIINGNDVVVAVCEEELLGAVLVDGRGRRFYVDPAFYSGERKSLREALEELRNASIGNIVGNTIVERAIAEGLVHEDAVMTIGEVRIAQFVNL
ncbi:MAG: DUF424 domain-containing protein [Desulfurococcaceae archaeon]